MYRAIHCLPCPYCDISAETTSTIFFCSRRVKREASSKTSCTHTGSGPAKSPLKKSNGF